MPFCAVRTRKPSMAEVMGIEYSLSSNDWTEMGKEVRFVFSLRGKFKTPATECTLPVVVLQGFAGENFGKSKAQPSLSKCR